MLYIVLSLDYRRELKSTVAGIMYLSLTNFTSVTYLIIRSLVSLLHEFVVGMMTSDSVELSSIVSVVISSFTDIFSEFLFLFVTLNLEFLELCRLDRSIYLGLLYGLVVVWYIRGAGCSCSEFRNCGGCVHT